MSKRRKRKRSQRVSSKPSGMSVRLTISPKELARLCKKIKSRVLQGRNSAKARLLIGRLDALSKGLNYEAGETFPIFAMKNVDAATDVAVNGGRTSLQEVLRCDSLALSTIADILKSWYCHLRQHELGSTPIWVEPDVALARALMTTSVDGLLEDELHLPFPAMLILLPKELQVRARSVTGVLYRVEALYFFDGGFIEVDAADQAILGTLHVRALHLGLDVIVERDPWGTFLCGPGGAPVEGANDSTLWGQFGLHSRLPLEQMFDTICGGLPYSHSLSDSNWNVWNVSIDGEEDFSLEGLRMLVRFCINLVLFMTSEQADIRELMPPRRVGGKPPRLSSVPTRTFKVGSRIKLDDVFHKPSETSGRTGSPLRYRTLVRGHFRNQACGPRHSRRKRIWIAPHVRGVDHPEPTRGHEYAAKTELATDASCSSCAATWANVDATFGLGWRRTLQRCPQCDNYLWEPID